MNHYPQTLVVVYCSLQCRHCFWTNLLKLAWKTLLLNDLCSTAQRNRSLSHSSLGLHAAELSITSEWRAVRQPARNQNKETQKWVIGSLSWNLLYMHAALPFTPVCQGRPSVFAVLVSRQYALVRWHWVGRQRQARTSSHSTQPPLWAQLMSPIFKVLWRV